MSQFEETHQKQIEAFAGQVEAIRAQIAREIIGQQATIDQLLIALIAGGNVLLEGVPGLGKTRLVRTMGHVLSLPFSRIQFTPDLMPADVTGTTIVEKTEQGNAFRFQPGPVFASIVLADEINRATPKTQSALLEAMQEHTVTVAGKTHDLPSPYFVLATQNPLEQEGTYPLPEAQLDRFFMKLIVDFPSLEDLHGIVNLTVSQDESQAEAVATGEDILRMRSLAKQVPIAHAVQDYALRLLLSTHPEREDSPEIARRFVRFGASPRAGQALIAGARVRALMSGRYNVSFEDIKALAFSVLRHRMALSFEGLAEGLTCDRILAQLLEALPVR
ncbi:MAG TPA: MoxR family ATPase [Clostridia bacterium]|nr:MoxR family ATPase [Clostridia bacterium]